jgi:uncharacterized protein
MPKLHFSKARYADLPLHNGKVPQWLYTRMSSLGSAIIYATAQSYGKNEVVRRFSDPFWFQALGSVLGMDWHSSGITTSVMGALKRSVNPMFNELGIYICGGKGKHSLETPAELFSIGERTGLNADQLVRSSRLVAKVDNNAIQDGFQVYLHSFILTDDGSWSVVQQGMNTNTGMARRYHWNSQELSSYTKQPHTSIIGERQGTILDLTNNNADNAKASMLSTIAEQPERIMREVQNLIMPSHHDVRIEDVNLKRLGAVLALAHDNDINDFESLLLLKDVGPRTIQSLALVSEVIHGTPVRFEDPARFSFAHGGKDGHPFPVPLKVYDETINVLSDSIEKAKLGYKDKSEAIKNLHVFAQNIEKDFIPNNDLQAVIDKEREDSWKYGGRTVFGDAKKPSKKNIQLRLF